MNNPPTAERSVDVPLSKVLNFYSGGAARGLIERGKVRGSVCWYSRNVRLMRSSMWESNFFNTVLFRHRIAIDIQDPVGGL